MENSNKSINGIIGGIIAGLMFGIGMASQGMMPMVAKLVGSDSVAVGWIIHMIISATIGVFFAWWFGNRIDSFIIAVVFGTIHGVIWWVLGALTIMPLLLGMGVQYANSFEKMNMMSLMGHIMYGIILGIVYYILMKKRPAA